ncbi:response regulator [Mangrovicoccus sp. HB161399]|uniref:response regulator n=1 Tax=Mangrovicoccus sp. HB161399 TaxID=2720392 RepID=UPI001557181F|nr:response regulator [Mangrovicoccus sp. HB161399]
MNILIVEDDPNLRALWADAFRRELHEVREAGTAQAARKALIAGGFDLVLLDLYLGCVPGQSVASLATYANPGCKMVLVAGAAGPSPVRLMGLSPAVVSVLRKPVDIEHIVAVCNHIGLALVPGAVGSGPTAAR